MKNEEAINEKNSARNPPKSQEDSTTKPQWPIAAVLIAFILVFGFLLYQCTPKGILDAGEGSIEKAAGTATKILGAFTRENIKTTLTDRLTSISDSKGGRLEAATINSIEVFNRSSTNWRGTTASEIRVPAVFKYHVSLTDPWTVETRENGTTNVCIVVAPKLKPSIPVPILTHKMERFSEEGWLRWDANEELDELTSEITPQLNRRARLKTKLAQDKARITVANFIKTWLLQADHWRSDRYSVIQVVFADELQPEKEVSSMEFNPTVSLKNHEE